MKNLVDIEFKDKLVKNYVCNTCKRAYIVRKCDVEYKKTGSYRLYCRECQKAYYLQQQAKKKEQEDLKWKQEQEIKQIEYENQLKKWKVIEVDSVELSDETLYVIGNGFDLMHGVKSSYYNFRDSLGRNSLLRSNLETFWTPEDIWADFENGIAHFNVRPFTERGMIDMRLNEFNAYDEDALMADYFLAVDSAAAPLVETIEELQNRFRKWVNSLRIGTEDRPLKNLFSNGKVLSFNYTEFAETLYNIPRENICYIHGCRVFRNKKLILGHKPGDSDSSFEFRESHKNRRNTFRKAYIDLAQEQAIAMIADSDEDITKNSQAIIADHEEFFKSIKDTQNIVIIGHSLSKVDWDYFKEIVQSVSDKSKLKWYIGVHCLHDLNNMVQLIHTLDINTDNIILLRTDLIKTTCFIEEPKRKSIIKKEYELGKSYSGKWIVNLKDETIQIIDSDKGIVVYEALFTKNAYKAVFDKSEIHLFVILAHGRDGVILFVYKNGEWILENELVGCPNQSIINIRLNKVYVNETTITFVYNNRVRKYSLDNGCLLENNAVRQAPLMDYCGAGLDISKYFIE